MLGISSATYGTVAPTRVCGAPNVGMIWKGGGLRGVNSCRCHHVGKRFARLLLLYQMSNIRWSICSLHGEYSVVGKANTNKIKKQKNRRTEEQDRSAGKVDWGVYV